MLADLLSESLAVDLEECWERERTAIASGRSPSASTRPVVRSGRQLLFLRLSALNGRMGRSGIGYIDCLTAHPNPPTAKPSRVAVDETAVKINGEWSWVYAAIDPRHKADSGCGAVRTPRHRSSGCVSLWPLRETRSLRHRVSGRSVRLSDCPCSTWTERSGRRHRSKRGFTPSRCESTASILRGWTVGGASANGLRYLSTTTTIPDRTNRSMDEHRSR